MTTTFDIGAFLFYLQYHLSGCLEDNVKESHRGEFYWRTKFEEEESGVRNSRHSCCVLDATFAYRPANECDQDDDEEKSDDLMNSQYLMMRLEIGAVIRVVQDARVASKTTRPLYKYYYCRIPVKLDDLEKHFATCGFDLDSTNEWVLAQTMAQAFLDSVWSSSRKISVRIQQDDREGEPTTGEEQKQQLPSFVLGIPLCYEEFNHLIANLQLTTTPTTCSNSREEPQVSKLTPAVMAYFRHNSQQDPHNNKADLTSAAATGAKDDETKEDENKQQLQKLWEGAKQQLKHQQQLIKARTEAPRKSLIDVQRVANVDRDNNQSPSKTSFSSRIRNAPNSPANSTTTATNINATGTIGDDDASRRRSPPPKPTTAPSPPVRKKPKLHSRVRTKKRTGGSRYAGSEQT